jgi:hypothetical protein
VVSTGILGDLVLPIGAFNPDRADEAHKLQGRLSDGAAAAGKRAFSELGLAKAENTGVSI